MSRRSELLNAAADVLEEHADPFNGAFLREHEVTLDEVMELGEDMAIGAQIAAWAIDHPKQAMTILRAGLLGARAEVITEALARLGL